MKHDTKPAAKAPPKNEEPKADAPKADEQKPDETKASDPTEGDARTLTEAERGALVGKALTEKDRERIRLLKKKAREAADLAAAFFDFCNDPETGVDRVKEDIATYFNEMAMRACERVENEALARSSPAAAPPEKAA